MDKSSCSWFRVKEK